MSNNLSASSKIKYSKFEKSTSKEFLFKSTIRPGVAITKSGSLLNSYSYFSNEIFPMHKAQLNLVYLFNSVNISKH